MSARHLSPIAQLATLAFMCLTLTDRADAQGNIGSTGNKIGAAAAGAAADTGPRLVTLSARSQRWCVSRPDDETCRLFDVEWSARFNGRITVPELFYSGLDVLGTTRGMLAVDMDVALCDYSSTVNPEAVVSCPGSRVPARVKENSTFNFENFTLQELKRTNPSFLIWIRKGGLVRDAFSTPFELNLRSDR